jgi:hypothetical protein
MSWASCLGNVINTIKFIFTRYYTLASLISRLTIRSYRHTFATSTIDHDKRLVTLSTSANLNDPQNVHKSMKLTPSRGFQYPVYPTKHLQYTPLSYENFNFNWNIPCIRSPKLRLTNCRNKCNSKQPSRASMPKQYSSIKFLKWKTARSLMHQKLFIHKQIKHSTLNGPSIKFLK